jgi:hypothetical protein
LGRVFARHLIPVELRRTICKLADLGECSGCDHLYHKTSFHECFIYGFSSCPRCIPSHFCLLLNRTPSHPPAFFPYGNLKNYSKTIVMCLNSSIRRRDPTGDSNVHCQADASNTHYVVDGFSKAQANVIDDFLVALRDGGWGGFAGFREMKIEFVGEKEELKNPPRWVWKLCLLVWNGSGWFWLLCVLVWYCLGWFWLLSLLLWYCVFT